MAAAVVAATTARESVAVVGRGRAGKAVVATVTVAEAMERAGVVMDLEVETAVAMARAGWARVAVGWVTVAVGSVAEVAMGTAAAAVAGGQAP